MHDIDFTHKQFNGITVAADWIRDLETSDSRLHKERVIEKPNGDPYLTVSDDRHMVSVQIHDYDYSGYPVKFQFDRRTIPALIDALSRLNRGELDAVIRTHSFNEDIK